MSSMCISFVKYANMPLLNGAKLKFEGMFYKDVAPMALGGVGGLWSGG